MGQERLWTFRFILTSLHNMRVYEVLLRSGAKADVSAESLHDDEIKENKIYFYRDKTHKQLVAYFVRDEVAGIIFGPDNPSNLMKSK